MNTHAAHARHRTSRGLHFCPDHPALDSNAAPSLINSPLKVRHPELAAAAAAVRAGSSAGSSSGDGSASNLVASPKKAGPGPAKQGAVGSARDLSVRVRSEPE